VKIRVYWASVDVTLYRGLFTTYHTSSLRIILEKSYEYNVDTHELYIHYKQAHYSTNRTQLIDYKKFGIPSKFVR